jgi:regulator of sigma E protease
VYRDDQVLEVPITPKGGRIGVERKTVARKFGFAGAVAESCRFSWTQTKLTFETLGRLLTGKISPKTMMGPLGIAKASGDAARGGVGSLFFLVAIISLQVGILNLFPLAPLDGGHMAIIASEGLFRRDFSVTVKAWILNAGAMVLFLLIGLVLYSDLSKTPWLSKYLP